MSFDTLHICFQAQLVLSDVPADRFVYLNLATLTKRLSLSRYILIQVKISN